MLLPQTIPSFSAQTTFRNFREFYPQFFYKEAALNSTNTADLAKDWERELIEKLRRQSRNAEGRELPHERGRAHYTVSYPLVIKRNPLGCHSTPERAPPPMVALYGSKNGFGWKLNETVGAVIISVLMTWPKPESGGTWDCSSAFRAPSS